MKNKEKTVVEKSPNKVNSFFKKVGKTFGTAGKTLWRWTKRTLMGASKEAAPDFSVEAIETPGKEIAKNFFSNKLAVISLVVFLVMFFLAIFGPLIWPMDVNYTQSRHVNLAPGYNFLKIPGKLSSNVKDLASFSYFSVGLSEDGKMYVWGNTKISNSATNANMKKYPEDLDKKEVKFIGAGVDHAIAITADGKVYGWGEYNNAQYGDKGSLYGQPTVINMPSILQRGRINVNNVQQLECGYQVSAIVMKDGTVIGWGNMNSGAGNMKELNKLTNVEKVGFLKSNAVALLKDGTLWLGKAEQQYPIIKVNGKEYPVEEYLKGKKITNFACTESAISVIIDGKELGTLGWISSDVPVPVFQEGEFPTAIEGGTSHFLVTTNKNRVYAFGGNEFGQATGFSSIKEGSTAYACSFQNYLVDENRDVVAKNGLKGYFFGTDDQGRDVFKRVIHGGKMTMTIGAVAVIISSLIGIIIGVISGYFGGWVDIVLMRITEVVSSIPFLPFAIILSAVLAGTSVTEDTRIFIIMVILGLLSWTGLARMVRGQVLAEREKEFVTAAKAMGVKENRIAFKHILPNVISVILVNMTLDFAGCMLTEASLSYLGFGVVLPRPTWGNMLNKCNSEIVISQFWWRWLFPSLFLLITTICINIIGDTLRDVMDPKSTKDK